MLNRLFLYLAKKMIGRITDSKILIDLSQWVMDNLPVDDLVIKKINDKLDYHSLLADPSYLIRRIQALRTSKIAGLLIRAGLVPHEHMICDSEGNMDSSVTISFAKKWIEEHYK